MVFSSMFLTMSGEPPSCLLGRLPAWYVLLGMLAVLFALNLATLDARAPGRFDCRSRVALQRAAATAQAAEGRRLAVRAGAGLVQKPCSAMAAAAVATPATSRCGPAAGLLGIGALRRSQLDVLQSLVTKHIVGPGRQAESAGGSTQWARRKRANGCGFMAMRKSYKHDPRTRLCELLKRWLRTHAANSRIGEDEVRRMCCLCRDVLNYPRVFPSSNSRSFMRTLAEVFDHMQLQLKEVLKRDRTCAELAAAALSVSRNLIADAIAYLLLASTDLKQTDRLPSLEVVALWQSLPVGKNPLPGRADSELQALMKDWGITGRHCVDLSLQLSSASSAPSGCSVALAPRTRPRLP
ncbi:unnamed protein product [Prorocentrum cordatum]|uniref:Uncharacterized protein n=1 Tax=Prorocentrum cordatum TaxID=2364126 RepID=A0ABN9TQM6_9DINO|nr:unnamed protein product [Polarella glacialis]